MYEGSSGIQVSRTGLFICLAAFARPCRHESMNSVGCECGDQMVVFFPQKDIIAHRAITGALESRSAIDADAYASRYGWPYVDQAERHCTCQETQRQTRLRGSGVERPGWPKGHTKDTPCVVQTQKRYRMLLGG
jgi:hypothetical protein